VRVGLTTLAVAAAWIAALPSAPVRQPIAFAHATHRTTGCAVCHRGAATAARAGIPDAALCAKCHATAPGGVSLAGDAAAPGRPISWVQVTRVADHVLFSHRRHVSIARIDCVSCHGEVRNRAVPVTRVAVRLTMDTCLSCHRQEHAAEDCAACHR
jgi:hypothetical protein